MLQAPTVKASSAGDALDLTNMTHVSKLCGGDHSGATYAIMLVTANNVLIHDAPVKPLG